MKLVTLTLTLLMIAIIVTPFDSVKAQNAVNNLKGMILLQVESKGEAWYVNPNDGKKYYMADGNQALQIMRKFGSGISNRNLTKIKTDPNYRKKFIGKIVLQVESHGEAYYISPDNRYNYLKDGASALAIMKKLGLGISNFNLNKIAVGSFSNQNQAAGQSPTPNPTATPNQPQNQITPPNMNVPSSNKNVSNDNLTYTNNQFGFSLNFPKTWKGYVVTNETVPGTAGVFNFGFSEQKSIFMVVAYAINMWNQSKHDNMTYYLGANDRYAFIYNPAQGGGNQSMSDRLSELKNIVATFSSK